MLFQVVQFLPAPNISLHNSGEDFSFLVTIQIRPIGKLADSFIKIGAQDNVQAVFITRYVNLEFGPNLIALSYEPAEIVYSKTHSGDWNDTVTVILGNVVNTG